MPFDTQTITPDQVQRVLALEEGHFADLKAIEVAPAKLTEFISAFANSDGGELYIGIDEDKSLRSRTWRGFASQEAANGHVQIFEKLFPLGRYFEYTFLSAPGQTGHVLRIAVARTPDIKKSSDGSVYIRRGAQKLKLSTLEELRRLEYAKGLSSFETELTKAPTASVTNSDEIIGFMLEIVPTAEPEAWLAKQQLIINGHPVVAAVLLFADEPQAILPKRSGIKVYRYKTADKAGSRETLAFDPITIEGPLYKQIAAAVSKTIALVQDAGALGEHGLEAVEYPREAIHEILTNAVIHRDYSEADDVHIRIFDNRIEVESPGCLPAHVTAANILDERYSRNGYIVRLLNKFPNPPNKDVGEGLNTAFAAMRKLGLKDPSVANRENSVLVTIKHERLASYEEQILEYLETHDTIKNKEARDLCHVDADYRMKRVLGRLEDRHLIERVPGTAYGATVYRKGRDFAQWRNSFKSDSAALQSEPSGTSSKSDPPKPEVG